jgi:hypothetical protein
LVLTIFALFSLLVTSRIALTPPLVQWKAEIEATGKTTIVLARVFTDTAHNQLVLPDDVEFRPILANLLRNEPFVAQFVQTHAMNANFHTGYRPVSVVFFNMARASDWEGQEEAVIAHEFGHIWLHVRGYPAPNVAGGLSCEALHAGDIVQHVLIREQMRNRRIDYLPFWTRTLETALDQLNKQADSASIGPDPCQRISRLALWVDVSLGISTKDWPRREEFLTALKRNSPELEASARAIAGMLRGRNLHDREVYQKALRSVLASVHQIG